MFQFHFGSIGRQQRYIEVSRFRSFNSTLVRLEVFLIVPVVCFSQRFQFHFGSIGSQIASIDDEDLNQFQFHFGSIGSRASKNKKIFMHNLLHFYKHTIFIPFYRRSPKMLFSQTFDNLFKSSHYQHTKQLHFIHSGYFSSFTSTQNNWSTTKGSQNRIQTLPLFPHYFLLKPLLLTGLKNNQTIGIFVHDFLCKNF